MRDPSAERDPSPRRRAAATLIGAALALAAAIYLTASSVDYALHGCGCSEPWYPEWIWIVTLALAAACYLAALALTWRAVIGWCERRTS